jgi:hypothetical protein
MKAMLLCTCVLVLACGCAHRTYEFDFSQFPDFQWDGKLKVTKTQYPYVGPLLTLESYWTVDRVELTARDARTAVIQSGTSDEPPVARVGPCAPMPLRLVGVDDVWGMRGMALIADPERVADELRRAATQPAMPRSMGGTRVWTPPEGLRPYAAHVDEIRLTEWWAIALDSTNQVCVDFTVPGEGLHVVMQGNPREYGPAVVEVRSDDGRVLRRFERQQVGVKEAGGQEH